MPGRPNFCFPLSREQYVDFHFSFLQEIATMEGMHSTFDEDRLTMIYHVFPQGLSNLIAWAWESSPEEEEIPAIMEVANKISQPEYFGDPHWARQFTEESLFDFTLALATNTLHKL